VEAKYEVEQEEPKMNRVFIPAEAMEE